jgi:glycine C-acetyltransferase
LEGDIPEAMALVNDLRENDRIFCSMVVYPVIPKGTILLRLIPTSVHTMEDVDKTIKAFSSIRKKLKEGFYKKIDASIQMDS